MADDDLEKTLAELAAAVRELQATIDADRQGRAVVPPERPDLLAMADEIVIPTLIASLETQIRVLRGIQRGARIARSVETDDRQSRRGPLREPIESGTSRTVDGIGEALDSLVDRLGSPQDGEVDEILSRTQSLYADLERRLSDDRIDIDRDRRGTEIEITDVSDPDDDGSSATGGGRDDDRTTVDVEAELDTLRDQYGTDRNSADSGGAATQKDGSGDPEANSEESEDEAGDEDGENGVSVGDDSIDGDGESIDRSTDSTDADPSRTESDDDDSGERSDERSGGNPS